MHEQGPGKGMQPTKLCKRQNGAGVYTDYTILELTPTD